MPALCSCPVGAKPYKVNTFISLLLKLFNMA